VPMSATSSALSRATAALALTLAFGGIALTHPPLALADGGGLLESSEATSDGSPTTNCCKEDPW
jgi:hypothetical protein